MKLSKFLFCLTIVTVFMFTVAFASENVLTKDNSLDKSAEEVVTESGEEVIAESGEEVIPAESGEEVVTAESGEEVVTTESGEEAVPAESGEEVVPAESGEEVVLAESGEEAVPAESGEEAVPAESGDEEIVANDVKSGDWFFPFVKDALSFGIMSLDDDGNFNPNEVATRKEAFDALTDAFETSYTLETDDPEEFLAKDTTREEVAYIVYLYAKSIDMGFKDSWMFLLEFDDTDQISEEAYEAMAWCVMNEIIIGRPDNTLAPQDTATRAEVATIMVRLNNSFNV